MLDTILSQRADKFLNKLEKHTKQRIKDKLNEISIISIPKNAMFIGRDKFNDKIFRIRIGDYRALYKIKGNMVFIIKIDKRPRVYHR